MSYVHEFRPLVGFDERVAEIKAENSGYPRQLAAFDKACASVDRAKIEGVLAKYSNRLTGDIDSKGPEKYLDVPHYIWHKTKIACSLNLDDGVKRNILDLGMGAGHFSLVCQALGHKAFGLDIKNALYEDVCEAFGVHRLTASINKGVPLPDFGAKFDLVTAFSLMFHLERSKDGRNYWGPEEWSWFFEDLNQHLNPNAQVYLIINPKKMPDGTTEMQHEITELFGRSGGKVIQPGRIVLFKTRGSSGISLKAA